MLTSEYLRYPADNLAPEYLLAKLDVDLGNETDNEQVAYNALKLLTAAYETHFEDPEQYPLPLRSGTVRAHFDPENDANVGQFLERIREYRAKGSEYLYIHQVGGRPETYSSS